ncbi:MAG: beta-lactamase hydrolase domain-containing protein [Phycisphaerales bacterium]
MKLRTDLTAIMLLATALGGCASVPVAQAPAEPEPVTIYQHERYLVSAQPSPADLAVAASLGVTTVINLRSDEEMAGLDFDERAAAEALGLNYIHIPMGRDHGYNPEQVAALAAVLDQGDAPVYMHCASGGRARLLWTAYMIDRKGMSPDMAIRTAEEHLGQSEPILDQLLGERIVYSRPAEPAPADQSESQ